MIENFKSLLGKSIYVVPSTERLEYIKTPSRYINRKLGGGYAKGRMHFVNGKESSGKTTWYLQLIAYNQRINPDFTALYIDAEHAFNMEYAEMLGIDLERVTVVQSVDIEEIFDLIFNSCCDIKKYNDKDRLKNSFKKNFDIIIVDSIDALQPEEDLKSDDITKNRMGLKPAAMNNGLKKTITAISRSKSTLFFIGQLRSNLSGYGGADITNGGRGKDYYATTRIDFGGGKKIENPTLGVIGNEVDVNIFKNKQGSPKQKTTFLLIYGEGFVFEKELLDEAIEYEIVKKSGSWFSYGETQLGQGEQAVINLLKDNTELLEELEAKLDELQK